MAEIMKEILENPLAMTEWASTVVYNAKNMSEDQKEFTQGVDEVARRVGSTGKDPNGEIASLIKRAFTNESVTAPDEVLSRMFNEGSIGEFDDFYDEKEPENSMRVYEATEGGNVDRAFLDHEIHKPQWRMLQAETDFTMKELRYGGYKTVANAIEKINEQLALKKFNMIFHAANAAIATGGANYIAAAGSMPTTADMDQLVLYLHDRLDDGDPLMMMLNKYRQAASKLAQAERWPTEMVKTRYNTTGFIDAYAGVEMLGFSGQKKMADGSLVLPDKTIFGVAGKIGDLMTRGEVRVLQEENINTEKVHVKVTGFTFGYVILKPENIAKMVLE